MSETAPAPMTWMMATLPHPESSPTCDLGLIQMEQPG
jgi:hypothetical protein